MMQQDFKEERKRFREWMEAQDEPLKKSTIDARLSNCAWIEKHLCFSNLPYKTLNEAFQDDGLFSIFQFLMFTPNSAHPLQDAIKGDLKSNLSTYRTALALFMEYKQGIKHDKRNQSKYEAAAYLNNKPKDSIDDLFKKETKIEPGNGQIAGLWKKYMKTKAEIAEALGRSANIEAEISELAASILHGGIQLAKSSKSTDVITPDGTRIQVKSRIPRQGKTTKLGTIRSWDFDILAVVLFNEDGSLINALEMDVEIAKEYAGDDKHVNGKVISTTRAFLSDPRIKNRTKEYSEILDML